MKPAKISDSNQRERPKSATAEPAEAFESETANVTTAMLGLQRLAGNAATSRLIARVPTVHAQRPKAFGEGVAEMLASEAPVLLGLIPHDQLEAMQGKLDATANNQEVAHERTQLHNKLEAADDFEDKRQFTPEVIHPEAFDKLDRQQMPVTDAPNRFTVDPQSVLDNAGLTTPSSKNNTFERLFRERIYKELTAGPITAEIAPMQWGARRGSIGVTYYSHDNYTLDHTKGIIHFADLTQGSGRYAKEYVAEVSDNPEVAQLRHALGTLAEQIAEIKADHFERSRLNAKHNNVRHVAEAFGGSADPFELMKLMVEMREHPEDGSLQEQMIELTNPYPSVKMWDIPEGELTQATQLLQNGDFDLAFIAFMQASGAAEKATERYEHYEEKVMKGAGIALKWLTRLKVAGKLAVGVATGGLALEAQAAVAAGYALLQEGAQQEAEVANGLRSSIDLGGLMKTAAAEGAMTFFGGLTQGAFTKTLTARFEVSLAEQFGPTIAKKMLSAGGAATATFYNVPANAVLNRIIAGAPMPKSMDELADMIVEETTKNMAMDVAMGFLPHDHGGVDSDANGGTDPAAKTEPSDPAPDHGTPDHATSDHGSPDHGGTEPGQSPGGSTPGGMPQSVAPAGGVKGPVLGDPHVLELAARASSSPEAREQLIDHFGSWEDTIAHLKEGRGDMAGVAVEARGEIIKALAAHRKGFVDELSAKFGAEQAKTASDEPGSDVDLNMTGPDAGAHSAEAMAFLDATHPGWRKRFRMDVLVDAGRSQNLSDALSTLPSTIREGISRRQALATEAFLVAREARNAETPEERTALLERISDPELKKRAEWLAGLDPAAAKAEQLKLLTHSDRAMAAIDPKGSVSDRAAQIGEALDTQALANALDPEAYISTGAIRSVVLGKPVDATGRYEAVIEQLDMLHHQAHEAGGMRGALRRYETFKYIQRICDQLSAAGIKDSRIGFLRNEGELVYKMDRNATSSPDARTVSPKDVTGKSNFAYGEYGEVPGVSNEFLAEVHEMLQGLVDDHLPLLRRQALGPGVKATDATPVKLPELGPEPPAVAPDPTPSGAGGPQSQASGPVQAPGQQAPQGTGLTDPNAVVRVADAITRGAAPAGSTLKAHADAILAPIAGELASLGTKPPTLQVMDFGKPDSWGYFDPVQNVIVVNEGALANGAPAFDPATPIGLQRLRNLVFHESRHAEQYFHAMRYISQATGGTAVPTAGIHPDIVQAAQAHPVQPNSPEAEIGRKAYDEFFGVDRPKMQYGQDSTRTNFLRNQIEQARAAKDMAQAEMQTVRWWELAKSWKLGTQIEKLQKDLIELKGELDRRNETYGSLFHEQDAWAAGSVIDKELPKARLRDTEQRLHAAWEMIDIVRLHAPHEETQALDNAAAAMRAYNEALEAIGLTMRAGPNPAAPAAASAAAAGAGAKTP